MLVCGIFWRSLRLFEVTNNLNKGKDSELEATKLVSEWRNLVFYMNASSFS